jgi:predicted nuclease of restriction endonuclease-like (RecB) superfamily
MSDIVLYKEAVIEIKNAILQSRYRAARMANGELLALYYGIGHYVSENTRSGKWGAGAIESISKQLQGELSGLRGFSPTNMKNMRIFYEKWCVSFESNRQSITDDFKKEIGTSFIRQLLTDELRSEDAEAFLRVGFTHHMAILFKCDSTDERWYYIRKCASEFWSVKSLKYHISANDYTKYGTMPSNFKLAIPNDEQASRAVYSFKDEYLLDFINVDEETDPELIDEPELHAHIVDHIRKFILAFGHGFCFIGSKYRVIVDEDEYFIDLLFSTERLIVL